MKLFSVFSAKGRWYKGNCHTHTTLSDGKASPKVVVEAYRSRGYDFVVLTDHHVCHASVDALQRADFLTINGAELHPVPQARPRITHHLIGIGIEKAPPKEWTARASAAAVIRWVKRRGGIAVYCHPYWTGHSLDHLREGRGAFGMEVYNRTTDVTLGLGDASVHLDHALAARFNWKAFAVDDMHRLERDGFGGWIMVKAKALTRAAIMGAIRRGHFYATTGPEIRSLRVRRDVVRLECSPVREIVWHCVGPYGKREAAGRRLLTAGEFDLARVTKTSHYLRVEIIDSRGGKAWSNPIRYERKRGRWED